MASGRRKMTTGSTKHSTVDAGGASCAGIATVGAAGERITDALVAGLFS